MVSPSVHGAYCEGLQDGLHVMKLIIHLAHCMGNSWHIVSFITLGAYKQRGAHKCRCRGAGNRHGEPKVESGIISQGLHLVASSALLFGGGVVAG